MGKIFGYEFHEIVDAQQKRVRLSKAIDVNKTGDHGADPIGNKMFKMVPSGDIVDFEERNRRLRGVK